MVGSLLFSILGVLYIVFAFREPPEVLANLLDVPVVFVFFAPERRMKLGRLTMGVLFILGGPLFWLLASSGLLGNGGDRGVLGTLVGLAALGVLAAARWKRAGEVSDAEDAERQAQWQSFEILKRDGRLHYLQQCLYAKGNRTVFEQPSDPMTYRVVYANLGDAKWQPLLAQDGAGASWLTAYLERSAAPKRVQATLDLRTGACVERKVGWLGWGMVPLQPRSA
jgi:hypothetical protein